MRTWTVVVLVALTGWVAAPVAASHTTRTTIEIEMGESFDLLRGAGELIEITANPSGILEIRPGGRSRVDVECARPGMTRVTLKYGAGGEVHTAIIDVTCKEKER